MNKEIVERMEAVLNRTRTVFLGTRWENGMRVSESQRMDADNCIALDVTMETDDNEI